MRALLSLLLLLVTGTHLYGQGEGMGSKRVVVGPITVTGNRVTNSKVILRELSISAGSLINADSIDALKQQNRLRLFNLQLFNEVDQDVTVVHDTAFWQIQVKERFYIVPKAILQFADRNINSWWVDHGHEPERVSAGLTLTDKNTFGHLEVLSVTVQAGYTKKLGLSCLVPYANKDYTHGIGVMGSIAEGRQTYYTTTFDKLQFAGAYDGPVIWRQYEGGLCYVSRPAYTTRHLVSATVKQYEVGDTIVRLNPDYFADTSRVARFAELFYRLEYNGTDNWNYSLRGEKLVTGLTVRAGWQGLSFQSMLNVEAGVFRNLWGRWYASAVGRGRLMYPQKQPYYFRNGLGSQTDYVRGYEYYFTDGYNYGLLRLSLKHELFNNTYYIPVRYFTAMPVRVYPKVFFDAGYIHSPLPGTNTLPNTALYSVGAGIDIVTFYDMKIRVEYARNHLGQNGVYLHFNSE